MDSEGYFHDAYNDVEEAKRNMNYLMDTSCWLRPWEKHTFLFMHSKRQFKAVGRHKMNIMHPNNIFLVSDGTLSLIIIHSKLNPRIFIEEYIRTMTFPFVLLPQDEYVEMERDSFFGDEYYDSIYHISRFGTSDVKCYQDLLFCMNQYLN